jgi:SAM-dependent methyltransferase
MKLAEDGERQFYRAQPIDNVEREVLLRYRAAATDVEKGLCCATQDDPNILSLLPAELVQKDYGCGNPSAYVDRGETVVDLGSGSGKICYVLSQRVGAGGRVVGVDFNDEMLALARKYSGQIAERLGYQNVSFVKAKIQDLALDLEVVEQWLRAHPINSVEQMGEFEATCERLRRARPLIPDASVDVVVSNCVLNLVRAEDKQRLFAEIFRVLKRGGRAVISDIVCDEDPTPYILSDPRLWSGCIAGAFREDHFLEMCEAAGFYGIEILSRQTEPWQVIDGIEFRSVTVRAFKGKEGPCLERNQAVIYKGPWNQVRDDDNHVFYRGRRMAVCDKTFSIMTSAVGAYARDIIAVPPREEVALEHAGQFACKGPTMRNPRETKGIEYRETVSGAGSACDCGPDGC